LLCGQTHLRLEIMGAVQFEKRKQLHETEESVPTHPTAR
jgi:hypothetical protein